MAFKTVTILGAKGMLGTDLAEIAEQSGFHVRGFDLPQFDICDKTQLEEVVSSGQVIVNCAAYTNVEKAETEKKFAYAVNAEAVGLLGRMAKACNVPVLHISTDFVFDGQKKEPYVESDPTNSLSVYGRSKAAGEQLLAESGCQYSIVRVQWTYGKHGNNFIAKIINAAQKQPVLKVVADQVGSPTHTVDAASILCRMLRLESFPQGVFHLAASGYVSRYDMTRTLFDVLGKAVDIQPCRTSDFPSAAKRPLNSRFDCTKLQTLLGLSFKPWQTMLKEYLESL